MTPLAFGANDWKIRKTQWSAADEANYQQFVQNFGEARASGKCKFISDCLAGSWNPYRSTDPQGVTYVTDCADLPYSLRLYFAWKNHLPFGYVSEVNAYDPSSAPPRTGTNLPDIRYSSGNYVVARDAMTTPSRGHFRDGVQEMKKVVDIVSTEIYRLHPTKADSSTLFGDFYSPTLDRAGVRAGDALYDPNGHVIQIYKVGDDGRVYYVDAHPHSELTFGQFGQKFVRSRPGVGAGFKRWRPIQLVGATADADGNWIGGKIVGTTNQELTQQGLFSTCQFYGCTDGRIDPTTDSNWQSGKFIWKGAAVSYYDYVRYALSVGDLKFHPLDEVKSMVAGLCQDLQDRATSVQDAITNRIELKTHPERLPTNIYGTSGEWEDYSTPSRDARLKTSFRELRTRVQEFVEKYQRGDSSIVYTGTNLKGDLLATYQYGADGCLTSYKNTAGTMITLGFDSIRKRLFDLSFDPYSCVELRWGAQRDELRTCQDDAVKMHWYDAEKYLRNQIDRRYDVRMDYTADELLALPPQVGEREAPDVDVVDYLQN